MTHPALRRIAKLPRAALGAGVIVAFVWSVGLFVLAGSLFALPMIVWNATRPEGKK